MPWRLQCELQTMDMFSVPVKEKSLFQTRAHHAVKVTEKQQRLSCFPTYTVCCLFTSNTSIHLPAFLIRLIIMAPKLKNFLSAGQDYLFMSGLLFSSTFLVIFPRFLKKKIAPSFIQSLSVSKSEISWEFNHFLSHLFYYLERKKKLSALFTLVYL